MHPYIRNRHELLEDLATLGAAHVTYAFYSPRRIIIPELPRGMITGENGHKYCYTGDVPATDLATLVKHTSVTEGAYYPSRAETPLRELRVLK